MRREVLKRYAAFYLLLDSFVFVGLAYYRVRARSLLRAISPELVSGEGYADYLRAAFASDALAVAFVLVLLSAAWLLSPLAKRLVPALSLLLAAGYASFMVFAADFLRVYQVAFGKSFVGGEHFTGISSMLASAATEISASSKIGLALLLAALLLSSLVALGRGAPRHGPRLYRIQRAVALSLPLVLALSLLLSAAAKEGQRGEELGRNPVAALVFGPRRETFTPPSAKPEARRESAAAYDSDSIESPGTARFLPAVKKGRYNVILYFFESTSWRYYDLELGGELVLPSMHALARNGLLLKNHYSNYPLSANTMYSVLSSRYSMYGKSMIFHEYFDADVDTITEVLAKEGYASCLIHTGDLLYASRNKFLANRDIGTFILRDELVKGAERKENVGWGADERLMTAPAIAWIKAQSSPYFLIVSPVNPHHPYAIPPDFPAIADPGEEGIGEGEKTWRNYLNSLHYADAAMGELVAGLEAEGLMEDTVFVMVTDHGEAFYQHRGNYNHPLFIYEENVHVPALVYSKALFPSGVEMDSITRHIDLMPSILDLLGVADVGRRDGESIFSPSREKMAVVHTSWNDEFMGVRDGRWKYIERMKDSREELYDLEADPSERENVAAANPAIAERYRRVSAEALSYMLGEAASLGKKGSAP